MDYQSKIREERTVTVYAGTTEPLATMHENDVRNLLNMILDENAKWAQLGSLTERQCRNEGMGRVALKLHLSVEVE
jgi:hypothetical protein